MKYELQMFIGLVVVGLAIRRYNWKAQFFLTLLMVAWLALNYFKPKP